MMDKTALAVALLVACQGYREPVARCDGDGGRHLGIVAVEATEYMGR